MISSMRNCLLGMVVVGCMSSAFGVGEVQTVAAGKFTFTYTSNNDTLVCTVSHAGDGWIGVGFGPEKRMFGANFIVGRANDSTGLVEDHYGNTPIAHKSDKALGGSSDVYATSCSFKDGITSMSFSIPYDSKDKNDVILTPKASLKVIFAMGKDRSFARIHNDLNKTMITVPVY